MNYPVYSQSGAGTPSLSIGLLATSIPVNFRLPSRNARLNGDTRRRKRRLREKLAKRDAIRYAPAIREAAAEMKRRVTDKIECEIFANAEHHARREAT